MFTAGKFASSVIKSSSRLSSKPKNLITTLINGAGNNNRGYSSDNNYGHDPRFLIIVDDEMKAQREAMKKNPSILAMMQSNNSSLDVNVTGLQENIIKILEKENPEWAEPYIEQLTKEMEEMRKQKPNDNKGISR